jgi:hypothetical protein
LTKKRYKREVRSLIVDEISSKVSQEDELADAMIGVR